MGGPLSGVVVQTAESQVGLDTAAIPTTTASLQTAGQTLALRFGRTRADLVALGDVAGIVQHVGPMGDITLQSREGLMLAAPMLLAQESQVCQRFHRAGLNHLRAERFPPLGRRIRPFSKQRLGTDDGVIAEVVVIQNPHIQHRQLLLILAANPFGPVADGVLAIGLVQVQLGRMTTHQMAQHLMVARCRGRIPMPTRWIVKGDQLDFLPPLIGADRPRWQGPKRMALLA